MRAKAGLNKSILDQGWHEFKRQLAYKLEWSGGILHVVPPHYTSQMCGSCGHTAAANRLTQSYFRCESCGMEINADKCCAKHSTQSPGAQGDGLWIESHKRSEAGTTEKAKGSQGYKRVSDSGSSRAV